MHDEQYSAAREKSSRVHDSHRPDLLVGDADLAQVGDRISDIKEVAKWVTLVQHVDRSVGAIVTAKNQSLAITSRSLKPASISFWKHRRPILPGGNAVGAATH